MPARALGRLRYPVATPRQGLSPAPAAAVLLPTGLRESQLFLLSLSPSSFHFRPSSSSLSRSNAALLACASGVSPLFFHSFQHSVDSSQLLSLWSGILSNKRQMQLMNLLPAKTRPPLFKMMAVAR